MGGRVTAVLAGEIDSKVSADGADAQRGLSETDMSR